MMEEEAEIKGSWSVGKHGIILNIVDDKEKDKVTGNEDISEFTHEIPYHWMDGEIRPIKIADIEEIDVYDLQERLIWLEKRQRQLGWLLLDGLFVMVGLVIFVYLILK